MFLTRVNYVLYFVSGGLFALALAPFFYWPIGLLSLAGLLFAVNNANTPKQAFINVWIFSLGQFLVGVSWIYVSINRFGGTHAIVASLLVFLFAGGLALIPAFVFYLKQRFLGHTLNWLTIPAFWFLAELVRGNLLTGFPWLFAGDGHLFTWLAGWAPVIGSYGISFILMLTVTVLWQVLHTKKYYLLSILLVWPIGAWLQTVEWTHATGSLNVSAVQGNIPQDKKWLPSMFSPTISAYYKQSSKNWQSDLILWPETAITVTQDQFRPFMEDMADEARDHNSTIITGIPYRHPRGTSLAGEYHNSIMAFGNGDGTYHKQRLVPFGEFVPFEKQIRGLIPFFDLEMSSFLPGTNQQALLKVNKTSAEGESLYLIAPFICYEIAYPQQVNQMAKNSDLLVTISNDAWFGDSLGPKQHMALAQMRALETGRWLLRSTNTGITALVDHKGHIVKQLLTNRRDTLSAVAEMRQGHTPYMNFWVWPLFVISALIILSSWLLHNKSKKMLY